MKSMPWPADYWELGVRNIVALRGDPPEPGRRPTHRIRAATPMPPRLVAGLKAIGSVRHFGRRLSGNPSGARATRKSDLDNLKRKVDAGADTRDHAILLLPGIPSLRFQDEVSGGRNG